MSINVDRIVGSDFLQEQRVLEMARKGELTAHPVGRVRKTWRFRISEVNADVSAMSNQRRGSIAAAVPATHERNRNG
jgi:hypothetical protein